VRFHDSAKNGAVGGVPKAIGRGSPVAFGVLKPCNDSDDKTNWRDWKMKITVAVALGFLSGFLAYATRLS
jgi:hypothetical protein